MIYILISLFAGCILPFAFAPFHIWPLTILSLTILIATWCHATPKQAFIRGLCYGIGSFAVGVSWVFVSIHVYGYTTIPIAILLTGMFIIILALFPAVQGIILAKYYKSNHIAKILIGFPTSWVIFEWIRSWIFTGFPWLFLGYSQLNSPLKGYAPIISVYGVSLATTISASLIAVLFIKNYKRKYISIIMIPLLWFGGWVLSQKTWTTLDPDAHSITLVQGNLTPDDKFAQHNPIQSTQDTYGTLSLQDIQSKIIIWPENSLSLPLPYSIEYLNKLDELLKSNESTLILGLPIQVENDHNHYYNSIKAIGQGSGEYYKRHLVPFGDYVPFETWLRGIINFFDLPMSAFTPGLIPTQPLQVPDVKILPLVCYEISYPQYVQQNLANQQSTVILNISEDGWFGNSWGPHQHLDIARMRALETGRFVIRSTTSGISAIIDPQGNIVKQSPQFIQHVLHGEFHNITGNTPWIKIGFWPLLSCLLILFFIGKQPFLTRK